MEQLNRTAKYFLILGTLFSDIVKNSGILQYEDPTIDSSDISVLLLKVIAKYENHPSVRLIKNKKNLSIFSFHYVKISDNEKIMNLDNSKAL